MSDFKLVKVPDERISGCSDVLTMGVMSSGSEITKQSFNAISSSNSSINFNIPIGSQSLIIDRKVTVQTDVYWQLTIGPGVANGQDALTLGKDSLQAFPLNSIFLTSNSQINTSNTSVQSQQIAPLIQRMTDQLTLAKSNPGCPNNIDKYYQSLVDMATGGSNNAMAPYIAGNNVEYLYGRGSFPIVCDSIQHWANADVGANYPNGACTDASLVSDNNNNMWVVKFHTTLIEPIFGLAPWLSEDSHLNSAGLYGVANCQFSFTIDQTLKRFWSTGTALPINAYVIQLGQSVTGVGAGSAMANQGLGFANAKINMTFLSPQPSDAINLPLKNCVPYQNYNQLITAVGNVGVNASSNKLTNTLTLSVVPDLIMVCVRKPMGLCTIKDANAFFTINKVVVQFSNKSGILSTLESFDLFQLSKRYGLQEMSYIEWQGSVPTAYAVSVGGNCMTPMYTTGSVLCFSPVALGLPDYITAGSAGQYTLTIDVTYKNTCAVAQDGEIAVTCVESGVFICQEGQSSIQIGVMTKDDVLDAKDSKEIIPQDNFEAQSGGSMTARIRTGMKHFLKHINHQKVNNHREHNQLEEEHGGAFSAGKRGHGKLNKYIR